MNNRINLAEGAVIRDKKFKLLSNPVTRPVSSPEYTVSLETLAREGWNNLLDYIEWLGLSKDQRIVVLSSIRHYYYDIEDMKGIKTLINLKGLNQIKQIGGFLQAVFNILQPGSNFIGFYVDNEKINYYELDNYSSIEFRKDTSDAIENGLVSRIPLINRLNGLVDSRTYKYMSKMYVSSMLENNGFKIMDITDLNGLTYFHSRRLCKNIN